MLSPQNLEDFSRRRGPNWRAGIVLVDSGRDQAGAAGYGCRHLHRILEITELQATGLANLPGDGLRDRLDPRLARRM